MKTMNVADSAARWLYRVGGVSALAIGVAYLVIFWLFAGVGAPPTVNDGQVWLTYFSGGRTNTWWIILALSVFTDVLYLPLGLALYFALRGVHRDAMLVATTLIALFVAVDLAVTWTHYASLLTLSAGYAASTDEIHRTAYVAAATYASAILTSRLLVVYAIGILSSGFLIIGLVMLKGIFSRPTAWLAALTGILGLASISGSSVAIILNAVCATVWMLLAGYRLYRLSSRE